MKKNSEENKEKWKRKQNKHINDQKTGKMLLEKKAHVYTRAYFSGRLCTW